MLKTIRYTLAAICLAASLGCSALWLYGLITPWCMNLHGCYRTAIVQVQIERGRALVNYNFGLVGLPSGVVVDHYYRMSDSATFEGSTVTQEELAARSQFGRVRNNLLIPLWFPALVFALAAVAAIRMRRFTLRSALVAMSVVAALLGMVVAL